MIWFTGKERELIFGGAEEAVTGNSDDLMRDLGRLIFGR
jgi:hypothetical protein